ncbi:DUF805 domain-containing protein [Pelomonas sp. Root1444]|uniref:DUF805 domain-containing protein n=1 Tax=Pelomonas sp. Root1444 TaxID=1736464 RepID=UPI0007037E7A|nr:DUF805 domain-containing protein [Pelomonas sp. Root1444]KQY90269.1 hypothetical protein ASD35_00180 [Pelomonas sp. Root1444]
MTFQDSIRTCFSKYADFSGRAGRSEYWWFALFLIGLYIVVSRLSTVAYWVVVLATFLPSLASAVRRLHDTGRSGWWLLLNLVPFIGFIIVLVLLAQESKEDALVA